MAGGELDHQVSWPYSTASPDSTRLAPRIPSTGATTSWATPSMSTAPSRSPARTRVPAHRSARERRSRQPARSPPRAIRCRAVFASSGRCNVRVRRSPAPVAARPPSARLQRDRPPLRSRVGPGGDRADRPSVGGGAPASAPSRTSSSPRPVAPSLAMSAGSSSSVSRSIAAWSAARSAAQRRRASRGIALAWRLGTRYTSSRAGGSSRDQLSVTGAMPRRAGSSRSRSRSARRRSTRSGTSGWAASV